ncbi:uncharacterized protein BX664DRAFT_319741 [Halteromyces radiatus]|uniref:uncharacterized protein n=1 Tax=Halteromyces radiatus TaxID=101107 RepID=UPI00221F1EE4|nr:uncharacterized protein BX664DRAFT_319741 [Halteromyces radiatus]KAI8098845.1 hypothetical protein BX664DRAFT_319741 [Halteromyces radiatus]
MKQQSLFSSSVSPDVTLVEGKLPLILSVPHGGDQLPSSIPNRTDGHLIADAYTISLAHKISHLIQSHYNAAPFLVILNIARRKVDVNRSILEGTESIQGQRVWKEYHDVLQRTINKVKTRYRYGLLLDIHGQAHKEGMVELGYLLNRTMLQRTTKKDERELIRHSSISDLADRIEQHRHGSAVSLLRGNGSFGYAMMMDQEDNHQVDVVPSPIHPYPVEHALYFAGGYITQTYHSSLDIIQIESPQRLRFSPQGHDLLARRIANAAIYMLDHYYLHDRAKL